ncbi:hypothetical protein BASA81_012786 [Batrachochytrium salamandrivorans]|nr:hypothetical protein BASA81_012786 [Batrachochytrium salamandrivorans]
MNIPLVLDLHTRAMGVLIKPGAAPFYHSPNGNIIVPHGYMIQSEFEGRTILGETKVFVYDSIPRVEYQFSTIIGEDIRLEGGFQISPYLASVSLVARLDSIGIPFASFDEGSNDNFQMGITSDSVQIELRRIHNFAAPPPAMLMQKRIAPETE